MVLQTLFALVVMVAPAQADVELFGRPGCAHCARAEHFLDELVLRMPDIAVVKHDVSSDKDAEGRLKELAADAGIKRLALPTLAVRGTLVIGFDDAQTTGAKVVALLEKSGQGAAFEESGICGVEPVDCADPEANAMVLPVFGRVELESLGLPVFTLLVGLVDGFNPCAMWVLLFLLSLLVNLRSRTRMALIGGVFVVVSGVVYFAFMAAWLNIFLLMALSRGVQIALGIVAITASSIHIKDAILPGHGPSLSIPDSAKPGIYARVRRIVLAENTLAALAATGTLAVAVNFVELLCTAGLPAIYTQILSRQELSAAGYYAYLGFYNVAYMADDALMLGVAITTLSRHRLQEGGGRWLKLVSGVVMAVLGLALIFKPELLTWPWRSTPFELQRSGVDAEALTARRRSVVKNVTEVPLAGAAHQLGADHAVGAVALCLDGVGPKRRGEARPAASRFELVVGGEQRLTATGAAIDAGVMVVHVRTGEGPLRALVTEDAVLLVGELLLPLRIRFLHPLDHGVPRHGGAPPRAREVSARSVTPGERSATPS